MSAHGPGVKMFVPCKLKNPLNGAHGHWAPKASARKRLRQGSHLLAASISWTCEAAVPKRVSFTAHVWSLFDSDGLAAAIKPIRDGLVDARLIHSDAPDSGHEFVYGQIVDRDRRGVEVRVEALR